MLFEKFFKIIKKSLQNQSHHTRYSYVIYIKCSFSALPSSLFSLLSSLPPCVRLWLHIDLYLAVGVGAHDDPRNIGVRAKHIKACHPERSRTFG